MKTILNVLKIILGLAVVGTVSGLDAHPDDRRDGDRPRNDNYTTRFGSDDCRGGGRQDRRWGARELQCGARPVSVRNHPVVIREGFCRYERPLYPRQVFRARPVVYVWRTGAPVEFSPAPVTIYPVSAEASVIAYKPMYSPQGDWVRRNQGAIGGATLGACIGAAVGNNTGNRRGSRGALIGGVLGLIGGVIFDANHSPPLMNPAPTMRDTRPNAEVERLEPGR